jgi:hypothetical protein
MGLPETSKLTPQTTPGQQPPKLQPDDRRSGPRFATQFRSTFSGRHEEGHGWALDLSLGGCKIESDMRVVEGRSFECRLHVPGLDWPIRIDEAIVRWVHGTTFGIALVRLRPEEQAKLKIVLNDLEQGG